MSFAFGCIKRRYRLVFTVLMIGLLAAVQIVQTVKTSSVGAAGSTEIVVGIAKAVSDPSWNETGYAQIKALVREAVDKAGGLENVIQPGDSVVVKVNMVEATPGGDYFDPLHPNNGIDTNCWVARAVVELAREAQAGSVCIAEGTAENTNNGTGDRFVTRLAFKQNGYDADEDMIDDYTHVPLIDLNDVGETYPTYPASSDVIYNPEKVRKVTLTNGMVRSEYWLPKTILDCDVLISVPTMKNHNGPGITGALKNAIGHAPNDIYHISGKPTLKNQLVHTNGTDGIHKTIVDLNLIRKPDFVVVDGLVGIMNGPAGYGARPKQPSPFRRLIIAGRDPVAVDSVSCLCMGYDYTMIPYLNYASSRGIGSRNLAQVTVKGPHIASVRYNFDYGGIYTNAPRADGVAPTLASIYPASGALVSGTIGVGTGTISENYGDAAVLKAELYVDGQFAQSTFTKPFQFAWDSRSVPDGSHELKVYVYDIWMNEANKSVTVNINNSSPMNALRGLGNGSSVDLGALVATTAGGDLSGRFYVESTDRTIGICVLSTGQSFAEGSLVEVSGTLTTAPGTGERAISASAVRLRGSAGRIRPLGMNNQTVGGAGAGNASGPEGGYGAHNVGLLVSTWGRVTHSESGFFYVDDGSGLLDGSGYKGIRMVCGSLTPPAENIRVRVMGVSSLESLMGHAVRCIRVRTQADIMQL